MRKKYRFSGGPVLEAFAAEEKQANPPYPLVGALINGELCGLNQVVSFESEVEPIYLSDLEGAVLCRNGLSFLLYQTICALQAGTSQAGAAQAGATQGGAAQAKTTLAKTEALELSAESCAELKAPKSLKALGSFTIGPTMGSSFYCYFDKDIPEQFVHLIEQQMRLWIEADIPIVLHEISYSNAEKLHGNKAEWQEYLSLSNHNSIPVYSLGDAQSELSSPKVFPCVHRTGLLQTFALMKTGEGFLLRFPPRSQAFALEDQPLSSPKFLDLYRSYKQWNRNVGVDNVAVLVSRTEQKKGIESLITLSEIHQQKGLSNIADQVAEKETVRLLLVAGPSSSGKTTFTKRLALHLDILGFQTVVVSLDDFYMAKKFAPKDSEGNPDLERLEALNLDLLAQCLSDLLAGKRVEFPRFDFAVGRPAEQGRLLELAPNAILLMEGIHGLNPELVPSVSREQKFHVFISALTQLNILPSQRMPTSDNRLLRRIVRDYQFRNHSAHETLAMWDSVQYGEHIHIFPHQNKADAVFNSVLEYEIPILKTYAAPLLKQVKPSQHTYARAKYLENILSFFPSIPANGVPKESILREFIGDSSFDY